MHSEIMPLIIPQFTLLLQNVNQDLLPSFLLWM